METRNLIGIVRIVLWFIFIGIPGTLVVFIRSFILAGLLNKCSECGSKLYDNGDEVKCLKCDRKTKTSYDQLTINNG